MPTHEVRLERRLIADTVGLNGSTDQKRTMVLDLK